MIETTTMGERPPHATHHCRHYDYVRSMTLAEQGPRCACGVDLSAPGAAQQCMPANVTLNRAASPPEPCSWREEHTDAERAAWEAWRNERAARSLVIIAQIPGSSRDKKNRPEWGKSGSFKCPACEDGTVRWSRASVNGHMRAVCTTADCFGVIE